MVTRRHVLKSAGVIGASGLVTLAVPDIARAAGILGAPAGRTSDFTGTRLVARLAAGDGPGQVGIRQGPGVAPGGPQSIAALADGRLAILDTLNGRVIYLTDGRPTGTVELPGALDPIDMETIGSGLTCLDPSAAKLYRIDGQAVSTDHVARADVEAVSRLARSGDRAVLIDEDSASFDARYSRSTRTNGFPDDSGGQMTVTYASARVPERRSARVRQGDGRTFDIVADHALGSVVPMGRDAAGRSYFQVSALVASDGGLDVDLTIRRFDPNGTAAGVARVPVRGRYSSPRRAVCFAPNGEAFALFPEERAVRVLQLSWAPRVESLRPLTSLIPTGMFTANAALQVANCRSTAIDIGRQYAHGTWIATQTNLNHHLRSDVSKPAYLVGPGQYYELPYCWGGMHVPQGFINEMNAGKLAGNALTTGGFKSGTSSVDCSGMVQQCWGVGNGHHGLGQPVLERLPPLGRLQRLLVVQGELRMLRTLAKDCEVNE